MQKLFSAAFLGLCILFLLAFSGCISIEDTDSRALCLKLSAYSESGVPECSSQEECLQKADKALFQFSQENFSYALRQKLFSLKSHLALSWLFLNKSKANLKKINAMCLSKSYAGLPTETNDFKYNSLNSAQESDKAILDSFSALLIATSDLERQKPELLKEEGLYNDYSLMRSSISDLKAKNANGNSFASKYFAASYRMETLEKKLGLSENAHYVTLLSALDYYDNPLLEKYAKQDFYLKLISNSAALVVSYFTSFEKLRSSARLLGQNPSQEVFSILGTIAAPSNSVLSEFSSAFSGLSGHYKEVVSKKESLKKETSALAFSLEAQVNSLSAGAFPSLGKNALLSLYSALEGPSGIGMKLHELEPESFSAQSRQRLSALRQNLSALNEGDFFGTIPLGEQVSGLKEARLEALRLKSEIDYYSTEIVSSLENLCDLRAGSALKQVRLPEASQSPLLSDLSARVQFRIQKMREGKGTDDYFSACASFAEEWNSYRGAFANKEKFRESQLKELQGCLEFFPGKTMGASKLNELSDSELGNALQNCLSQKSEIVFEFLGSDQAKEISRALSESRQNLELLKALFSSGSSVMSESDLSAYTIELEELSKKLFSGGGLPNSLSLLPELRKELFNSRDELARRLSLSLQDFAEKKSIVSVSSSGPIVAGKESAFVLRIFVPSPFSRQANYSFSAEMPAEGLPADAAQTFRSSGITSAVPKEKSVFAEFSGISAEGERLEFEFGSIPAGFSEELSPLYVSEENAVIESKISLSVRIAQKSLLVPLKDFASDMLGISRTRAFSEGEELKIVSDSNASYVFVPNPKNGQKISIYYFVLEPVSAVQRLEYQKEDSKGSVRNYSLNISSRLPFALNNFLFVLPLSMQAGSTELGGITDSRGKRPELVMLSDEKPAIRISSLEPGQAITVYFTFFVSGAGDYWGSLEAEASRALSALSNSSNPGIAEEARALMQRLKIAGFQNSGKELENELLEIYSKVKRLEESEKGLNSASSEYFSISQKAISAKQSLEEKSSQALRSGFPELSSSLSKQAKLLESAIAKASQVSASDFAGATGMLLKALPSFSGQDPISVQIVSDKNSLAAKAFGILEKFRNLSFEAPRAETEILSLEDRIDYSLSILDFAGAASLLNELKAATAELEKDLGRKSLERLSGQKTRLQSLIEMADREIPSGISAIEAMLSKVSEQEIDAARYFSPISRSHLKEAKAKLALILSPSFRQKIAGVLESPSRDNISLLEQIQPILPEFEERLARANSLARELDKKTLLVKEDSIAFFSQASSATKLNPGPQASQALSLAKSALEKKDYLNSIILSKKAIGLAALSGNAGSEGLPIAVYPLLLVIAIAMVFRIKKGKPKSAQAPSKKLERISASDYGLKKQDLSEAVT